jgi:4,5-DOPA dioxygenase extradiol
MESQPHPVLFASHGAPTLALDGGAWAERLGAWARGLGEVRAVVLVSAHWERPGAAAVMAAPHPETWHDFSGFPEPLYQIRYPAPGQPELAARVAGLLSAGGVEVVLDPVRPLDHGAWVPLRAAFPEARVPVVQVSLPAERSPRTMFELGRLLAPLRREGVLLAGSGGIVHNLHLLDWSGRPEPAGWAADFEAWVAGRLEAGEADRLLDEAARQPGYARAVPTSEHFDPLYFALGAAGPAPATALCRDWQYGSLSLGTWTWA